MFGSKQSLFTIRFKNSGHLTDISRYRYDMKNNETLYYDCFFLMKIHILQPFLDRYHATILEIVSFTIRAQVVYFTINCSNWRKKSHKVRMQQHFRVKKNNICMYVLRVVESRAVSEGAILLACRKHPTKWAIANSML